MPEDHRLHRDKEQTTLEPSRLETLGKVAGVVGKTVWKGLLTLHGFPTAEERLERERRLSEIEAQEKQFSAPSPTSSDLATSSVVKSIETPAPSMRGETKESDTQDQTFADCITPDEIPTRAGGSISHNVIPVFNAAGESEVEDSEQTNTTIETAVEAPPAGLAEEARIIETWKGTIDSARHFPMAPDLVWDQSKMSKRGDGCLVAWCFSDSTQLNISRGVVKSVKKRAGAGRIAISYEGVEGHKSGTKFEGFIPPNPNVRIHSIRWLDEPRRNAGETNSTEDKDRHDLDHTEADLDLDPMPTLRSVSSEFVPCVVAIYRDIMRDYASSSYEQRNQIWNRTLSAMKHSLATVRHIIGKKRRRRPVEIQETTTLNSEAEQKASDLRAIKKATRLLLEGATKKGTRVLDQETATTTMTDEGKLDQLRKLHPSLPISFALPTDAPKIACLPPQELRDAGKRLAKGSAPGPSGTTEAIVRLLS